jgi:hypothetical protein
MLKTHNSRHTALLRAKCQCNLLSGWLLTSTLAPPPPPPQHTHRENLAYAAHLKLPRDLADAHRRGAVIDDALEMLQLKHIQHYRVGQLGVEHRGMVDQPRT